MASIEERKVQRGTSYVIRFTRNGESKRVFLDTSYSRHDAEAVRLAIQGFLDAEKKNEPLDRRTKEFFDSAPPDLIKRFGNLGFGVAKQQLTIAEIWKEFRRFEESSVKPSTIQHREIVFSRFRAFFPDGVKFDDLTLVRVQEFRDQLIRLYAPTTVAKSIKDLRTFCTWAMKRGYARENPFADVPAGATGNRERDFQVPAEWAERILDACPTQCWRTLFCLWRFAGLRQQEPILLTRESVDLESLRLSVYATKTERYLSGGFRSVPIVPILARELKRHLETMPQGEHYLIYEERRKAFDRGFQYILIQAGLERWPKTFQNMRASCENDWIADGIPAHVVADWLGHSVKTQEKYYLRVLPEYFDRVTRKNATILSNEKSWQKSWQKTIEK